MPLLRQVMRETDVRPSHLVDVDFWTHQWLHDQSPIALANRLDSHYGRLGSSNALHAHVSCGLPEPTQGSTRGALGRDSRHASREISRGRLGMQIRTSQVDNVTDVALAKVENLTMATGNAMQHVTRIAQAQQQLEQMTPAASGRLEYLAQDHMFGCAELLADLRRDMRRVK